MSSRASGNALLLVTVLLVTANLRPAITVVGPLIERIGAQTALSPLALGALGSIPILAFGVVSPFVHLLGRRFGLERTIFAALLVLAAGTLIRGVPGQLLLPPEITLYVGTAILSAAIGVGNVLVPAVVKRDFPDRVPMMTGIYTATLVAAAAVFSGAAVPMATSIGWEAALTVPAVLALVAVAGWGLRRSKRREELATGPMPLTGAGVPTAIWRQPLAWQVTLYFGLQSTLFYVLLTWFPAIQTSHGVNEAAAGMWLGIFQAVGVAGSLLVGQMLQRMHDQRAVSAVVAGILIVGLIGIMILPGLMPVWAVLTGMATGCSLLLALTFVSLRARTPTQVGKLSGMAQGAGYLIAACGPIAAGAVYQAVGSWSPVLWGAIVLAILQGVAGHFAARRTTLH